MGCGTLFLAENTYKQWIWKRQFLKKAMNDGGRLSGCTWIKISEYVQLGSVKERHDAIKGKFMIVFKCLECSAHTIFDAYGFNNRANAPKLDKSSLEPLKSMLSGSKHKKAAKQHTDPVKKEEQSSPIQEERTITSPPQTKPPSTAVTHQSTAKPKGLHKFLQLKQKSTANKTQPGSSGGLGDFLLDLNNNRK